jgi:hypothetical protein
MLVKQCVSIGFLASNFNRICREPLRMRTSNDNFLRARQRQFRWVFTIVLANTEPANINRTIEPIIAFLIFATAVRRILATRTLRPRKSFDELAAFRAQSLAVINGVIT